MVSVSLWMTSRSPRVYFRLAGDFVQLIKELFFQIIKFFHVPLYSFHAVGAAGAVGNGRGHGAGVGGHAVAHVGEAPLDDVLRFVLLQIKGADIAFRTAGTHCGRPDCGCPMAVTAFSFGAVRRAARLVCPFRAGPHALALLCQCQLPFVAPSV